ncbi:MAG: dTDP-4-dehydrorhamnose 3,5-epimerase [Salibacteraceae bacterium]
MQVQNTPLEGLKVIHPRVFNDPRGYFYESYNQETFRAAGLDLYFVQDNQSLSQRGVLRGLHLQNPPFAQGKLVRVIAGSVLDVVVDVRRASSTYGQSYTHELNGDNKTMLWIPPGFAHGFLTLENDTVFSYKCTAVYNKESERGIRWNDPALKIDWGIADPLVSDKDLELPPFADFESLF